MQALRWLMLCALLGGASVWAAPRAAQAQDTGLAVITSPLEGAIVAGRVPITGSASHPQFQRYEIAFGYSPNPTDAWFSLQDPSTVLVSNDILAYWDTANISDGVYSLRLRVYWSDRDFMEMVVRNVRVQNTPPTATPTPAPSATPAPTNTPLAPAIALPATPTAIRINNVGGQATAVPGPQPTPIIGFSRMNEAFMDGVRFTIVCFLILGAYAGAQALFRALAARR